MREYVLTEGQLRDLARGHGATDAVSLLTDAQMSRRRLMLLAAAERALDTSPDLRTVLSLVAAIDRRAPQAGRDLLRHPYLETWFAGVASPATGDSTTYLGTLAAATAVRAGLPFDLTLASVGAELVLPGLGVAGGVGVGQLSLRFDGRTLTVQDGRTSITVPAPFTSATESWRPAFHVRLPGVTVEVDDVDPLRDRFTEAPLDRMAEEERTAFARALADAWELLTTEQPEHAAGMSRTLHKLVPLRRPADGSQVSASGRACFGAIGISPTDDPVTIAELLLHESRHETLDALLDLVELCRPGGPARFHAPWRADARTAEALTQGVYAFAGVTQFWLERRLHLSGTAARRADFTFAYWREQVDHALAQLLPSGELTDLGRLFFTEIESVLKGWREESAAADAAWLSAVAARIGWRLTHHRVDQALVEALGRAWARGEPGAVPVSDPSIVEGPSPGTELSDLIKESWLAGAPVTEDATALEREILRGDPDRALRTAGHPRSTRDWIAVTVALTMARKDEDAMAYRRPEVLRAVSAETEKAGRAPDAVALARWLSSPS
jgi:uncharacterized protein